MKKKVLSPWLFAACLLCSCSDSVEPVVFDVAAPEGLEIQAGEPLRFLFSGNPDYITFYSGEEGSDYASADRYVAEISSLTLSCAVRQQYNDRDYLDRQLLWAYVSDNFSGEYTPQAINAAKWTPLCGSGANSLPLPVAASAQAVSVEGTVDLGAYTDPGRPFYLAFLYTAPGRASIPSANGGGRYVVRPRVDVSDLCLIKTLADGSIQTLDNAASQLGFRPVYESSFNRTNYRATDDGLLFQPAAASYDPSTGLEPDERVWMVSTRINPRKVEPSRGISLKGTDSRLSDYSYSYAKPGVYTATFVATNANLWDNERVVRQLTITVK